MSTRKSPVAQRVVAAPSRVPRTLWRSGAASTALARLVRLYGLPRELDANPRGAAIWRSRDLHDTPLCRITLSDDSDVPLCFACKLRPDGARSGTTPLKNAVDLCNARIWLEGGELVSAGEHEDECLCALAMIACTMHDLLHPEEIHDNSAFVDEWLDAAASSEGFLRLEALLSYAISDGKRKSYEDFIELLDDY